MTRPLPVLVTGSEGALGQALVAAIAAAGWQPVRLDLRVPEQASAAYACDLRRLDQVRDVFTRVQEDLGPVHGLVNNAGVVAGKGFLELSEAEFDTTMDVNLKATYFCSQYAARQMIAAGGGGRIVHLSSAAARRGSRSADYAASKSALAGLTRSMAWELAPHGILVNAVAPGVIDTAMNARLEAPLRQRFIDATALRRIAQPAEVATVVTFLLSPQAAYMTGTVVEVDGGMA